MVEITKNPGIQPIHTFLNSRMTSLWVHVNLFISSNDTDGQNITSTGIIWIRWGNKEDKHDKAQMRKNEIFKIKQNIKFGDAFIWE